MFVVSLPYTVANGGYWALLAMLLVAYICCYTGKILVDCLYDDDDDEVVNFFTQKKSAIFSRTSKFLPSIDICISRRRHRVRTSYVDIATDVWGGRLGAGLVNLAQNIELLMTCILYLVLCGDLFVGSFPNSPLDHSSWTMISCMFLIPCAFIRSLKFVSKLSFYNAIVHLIINVIIVFYCLTRFREWDFSKIEIKINVWSFPISLGIIVFSYTSQIFLPTLEGSMVDRSKFDSMLNSTHWIAALFKAGFGLIGFLTWQEKTDEVITNNLDSGLKILVNIILVIKALLSYPLPYFASAALLESTLFLSSDESDHCEDPETMEKRRMRKSTSNLHGISSGGSSTSAVFMRSCYDSDGDLNFWAVCLRIGLIIFTLFLAIFIPHFAILMGLIGNITGVMLSLIWPCYFHLHLKGKNLKWYQRAFDWLIIAFACFISVTGIYYSSIALAKALRNENPFQNPDYYKKNSYFGPSNSLRHNHHRHNRTAAAFTTAKP
jgi:vesicular inhibitory amino acid transporter